MEDILIYMLASVPSIDGTILWKSLLHLSKYTDLLLNEEFICKSIVMKYFDNIRSPQHINRKHTIPSVNIISSRSIYRVYDDTLPENYKSWKSVLLHIIKVNEQLGDRCTIHRISNKHSKYESTMDPYIRTNNIINTYIHIR